MKIVLDKVSYFIKEFRWVYCLVAAVFFYSIICYAKVKSVDVPIIHMDGAFQTASALFRLLQGELPGRDFYPYLGVGPIGLLYPIFVLAGAHVCASVFASYVMVFVVNGLAVALLIHLIWKPKCFLLSIALASALSSIPLLFIMQSSPFVGMYSLPVWASAMITPGNSLRPLRGFIGYLAIFALYFIIFPEQNRRRKYAYYSVTLAIVSLWSNDYALPTLSVLFLLALANFIKESREHFIKTIVHFTFISIISVVFAHWLVTGGHPLKLATYNFVDVARDQWWYFGPWKFGSRVFFPQDVLNISTIQTHYSHYVLIASFAAIFIFKHLRQELLLVFALGVIALVGGLVACIGGHLGDFYFRGFIFWAKMVAILFGLRLIIALVFIVMERGKKVLWILTVCCCALVVSAHAVYAHQEWTNIKQQRKKYAAYIFVPELGGYLDQGWNDYIKYIKAHKDKTTVEEYSGIWSAMLNKTSIWPVDSPIHALGGVRQVAETILREKADIIVTSKRSLSHTWTGWNISGNYWFYKILFESYMPVFTSPTTIVWEKSKSRPVGKSISCKISDGKDRIYLETTDVGYYEVQLKTKTTKLKNNRYLAMFENNVNFAGDENGNLSLSLYDQNPIFPVYVSNKDNIDFGFNIRPAGTARVSIESCSARAISFKDERVLMMSEGVSNIYDKNYKYGNIYSDINYWDRGIATKQAGFFVFKDKKALAEFKIGNVVKLPNHEMRIITRVLGGFGEFLEVYLDGPILKPDIVGSPDTFSVISDVDKLETLTNVLGDAVYLTNDIEWINGISRLSAGFVVPNTAQNRGLFKVPHRVQIPNTMERRIINATPNGIFLRVTVDGAVLDSKTVGLPSTFKAISEK